MKYKGTVKVICENTKRIIMITLIAVLIALMLFIFETYAATGIANIKNEDTLVRLAQAKAMALNTDRSVTLAQVKTAMETYVPSSSIAVTEDTSAVYVKYNSTGNTYTIFKGLTYTVTYNANGGSGAPASQTKKQGVPLTLSSTRPTRDGYMFMGWATSSTAESGTYSPGATYTSNSNLTLYAVWAANAVEFYPGTTVQYRATNVVDYGDFYSQSHSGGGTNQNSTIAYIAIDLTEINTLTVTGSFNSDLEGDGSGSGCCAGAWLATYEQLFSKESGGCRNPYYTIGPGPDQTYYTLMQRVTNGESATEFEFDVSGLTGTYYLCIGAYVNNTDQSAPYQWAGASVTRVVGIKASQNVQNGDIIRQGIEIMPCTAQRYTATVSRTFNEGSVTLTAQNSSWEGTLVAADGCYRLTDKLDLTNISKITLKVESRSGYLSSSSLYVTQQREDMYSSYASSYYCPAIVTVNGAGEFELDVSSLSGEYWVGLHLKCDGPYASNSYSITISDWWYE